MYNEIDDYAATWLENLIAGGHIAPGPVDRRSIVDLRPEDVAGNHQVHFFAGIGVWSAALRAAGWRGSEIWTGSCPCQPFSGAGKRAGTADARHLWPVWFELIRICRPAIILGEQVASPDALGWLDAVFADLEGAGYACAAVDFCAASVGAPHWRQRLYWVAQSDRNGRDQARIGIAAPRYDGAIGNGSVRGLVDTPRLGHRPHNMEPVTGWGEYPTRQANGAYAAADSGRPGPVNGFWRDADWLRCTDGKWRPTKPGIFPLVDGYPNRVGMLRAAGNAIVLPQATSFIKAVMSCI